MEAAFDVVVLGSGGGPDETNLSGYLLKPREACWEGAIIALEAGSGLGALDRILKGNPALFAYEPRADDSPNHDEQNARPRSAYDIYSCITSFLITHAHLDHVNSLVLSAGSLGGPRKRIYGALQTLKDIEGIFSGRIWPNLASWREEDELCRLVYHTLPIEQKYKSISEDISVRMMPLSHGHNEELGGIYDSAAFFIRHDPSGHELLFLGDVEPDSVSLKPQTIYVWRAAASRIRRTLTAIFIECSWPSGRSDNVLYGHLSPEHVSAELLVLAREVIMARNSSEHDSDTLRGQDSQPLRKKRRTSIPRESLHGALEGVKIYITHCKADIEGRYNQPINHVIVEQIRSLVDMNNLGAEIVAVDQGMILSI